MQQRVKKLPNGTPANLTGLLRGGQQGYELRYGYSLELEHSLMGYFPALFKGTRTIVVVFDLGLIEKVWETLSTRQSKLNTSLFAVNFQTGVCYPITGVTEYDLKTSKAMLFLTREEFGQLTAADSHPFEWAPGLIGDDMSLAEFRQTLEAVAQEHGVTLPG